jgi:putative transposase
LDRDENAAINILLKAIEILLKAKNTEGHSEINASGVGTSTLLGASLVEQVLTVNEESSCLDC